MNEQRQINAVNQNKIKKFEKIPKQKNVNEAHSASVVEKAKHKRKYGEFIFACKQIE